MTADQGIPDILQGVFNGLDFRDQYREQWGRS
jgi:hypothetical protein